MREWTKELTGRVLVLVAHADDECVGWGARLQRMREPWVVVATDGAPRDDYFWKQYGSRQAYRELRGREAARAMALVGVRQLTLLASLEPRLEDQRLFLELEAAWSALRRIAREARPEAIATLAYEGGHPDHDSCSLLGSRLGQALSIPVWEAPLYAREPEGEMRLQRFLNETGEEADMEITPAELERKRAMAAQYASQGKFLEIFEAGREPVRPQARYDYSRPPHPWPSNYERWQWWMSATQVSASFARFLEAAA